MLKQIVNSTAESQPSNNTTSKQVINVIPGCQCPLSRNQQYQKLNHDSLFPEQCIALLSTLAQQNKVHQYVYNTWSLSFDTWRVCGLCHILDKKHRRAIYQMTVTIYYIYHTLKQGFCGNFSRYFIEILLHLTFLH